MEYCCKLQSVSIHVNCKMENNKKENGVKLKGIAEILCHDKTLVENWRKLSDFLGLNRTQIAELDRTFKNGTVESYDVIYAVLDLWLKLPNCIPTINQLIIHLEKDLKLKSLKEALSSTFSSDSIIDNKPFVWNGKKWWPGPIELVNSFLERKDGDDLIVSRVHEMLTKTEPGIEKTTTRKVVISGFGGIGKTTLAKWYADYYKDHYDYIIWLDCGESQLYHSFKKLVGSLNISMSTKELHLRELAKEIFGFFALYDCHCLFIFDNAEEFSGPNGIKKVLPIQQEHQKAKYHIIITSRYKKWGSASGFGPIPQYQLGLFSIQDSLAFLKKHLLDCEEYILKEICQLVGNLPLALQIIIAAIQNSDESVERFLEYMKTSNSILIKKDEGIEDYDMTIYTALQISLDRVKKNKEFGKLAINILWHLGFLKPEHVEVDYIYSLLKESKTETLYAIEFLEKYSLVSIANSRIYDTNVKTVSIHRLLQDVLRELSKELQEEILRNILSESSSINMEYKFMPCLTATKFQNLNSLCQTVMEQLTSRLRLTTYIYPGELENAYGFSKIHLKYFQASFVYPITRAIAEKSIEGKVFRTLFNHGLVCYITQRYTEGLEVLQFLSNCRSVMEIEIPIKDNGKITLDFYNDSIESHQQMPDYVLRVLIVHLLHKLNRSDEMKGELLKLNAEKRNKLLLTSGNGYEIQLDLALMGLDNTYELVLEGGTILVRKKNENSGNRFPSICPESISLANVQFIDEDDNYLEMIDMSQILPNCREVEIKPLLFQNTITNLPFYSRKITVRSAKLDLNVSDDFSPLVEFLSLNAVKIIGDLGICLEHYKMLVILELVFPFMDETVVLPLSCLPKSLKKLLMKGVELDFNDMSPENELNLEKVKLERYSLQDIRQFCGLIRSKLYILDGVLAINDNHKVLSEVLEICKHTYLTDVSPLKPYAKDYGIMINENKESRPKFLSLSDNQYYEFKGKIGQILWKYTDAWY